MRAVRMEIYRDRQRLWRWRLVAANGRIFADSAEGYANRSNAKRAANRVRETAAYCVTIVTG